MLKWPFSSAGKETVDWQISCFHAIVSGVFTECLPAVLVSSQQEIYDQKTIYLFFSLSLVVHEEKQGDNNNNNNKKYRVLNWC